jgi:hypothetical protein
MKLLMGLNAFVSKFALFRFGICIPSNCEAKDIERALNKGKKTTQNRKVKEYAHLAKFFTSVLRLVLNILIYCKLLLLLLFFFFFFFF